jgi:hypothetical protein
MPGPSWLGRKKTGFLRLLPITLSIFIFFRLENSNSAQPAAPPENLTITCAPDKPVAHPGESIVVRAWINSLDTSVVQTENIEWKSSIGTITGKAVATWSFPSDEVTPDSDAPSTAKAFVTHKLLGRAECQLLVYFVDPLIIRGPARPALISGRTFLLPGQKEPEGYGLYSYLLFDTPPKNDADRQRYLKGIESYLLVLAPLQELELYKDRSLLNVTLIPLKESIDLSDGLTEPKQTHEAAEQLLRLYDYARARVMLTEFGIQSINSGPFLVSSRLATGGSHSMRLFFDMSRVSPMLVWDWTKTFTILSTQEVSWKDEILQKLALKIRNIIAIAAKDTPEVVGALQTWIQLLKPN